MIQRERHYFATHADRMNYQTVARRGWPIGSGAVESACRQKQCRFKRPGQFWTTHRPRSIGIPPKASRAHISGAEKQSRPSYCTAIRAKLFQSKCHYFHFFLPAELGNVGPTAQVPFGGHPFPCPRGFRRQSPDQSGSFPARPLIHICVHLRSSAFICG